MKVKINKKKYVVITSAIIVLSFTASGFLYHKKVQVKELESKFNLAIKKSQYNEALKIYKSANEDKVIKKVFSFNDGAEELVNNESSSLEADYLEYEISFGEFVDKENELSKFEFMDTNKLKQLQAKAASTETVRVQYNECEALYEKKEYAKALLELDKISAEDFKTKDMINTLRTNIKKEYKEDVSKQIDSVVKNEKFNDGIEILNSNKNLFSEEEINNKTSEINKLIIAKAEAEKKKKALEEENRKQEEIKKEQALFGAYLNGYSPNPNKENSVKEVESQTKFLLTVELNQQITNVFIGKKGEWKLIKSIICSTGSSGYDTPKGSFKISSRGNWFFNKKYSEGAEYWTSFLGDYLFHSLPMNTNHVVIDETLGKAASHGCVRMKIEDAKWIFNNINSGTKVIVR